MRRTNTNDSLKRISAITLGYENDVYRIGQKTIKALFKTLEHITDQKFNYYLHGSSLVMQISPGIELHGGLIQKVDLDKAIDIYTQLAKENPNHTNTKIFKTIMEILNFVKILDESYNIPIIAPRHVSN